MGSKSNAIAILVSGFIYSFLFMVEYLFSFQRILISKRNTAQHQPSQLQKIRKILIMETFRDLFFRFFFGHAAPTVADCLRIPDFQKN